MPVTVRQQRVCIAQFHLTLCSVVTLCTCCCVCLFSLLGTVTATAECFHGSLSCVYTREYRLRTLCPRIFSENLFFHELLANQRKMTNQLRRQLHENYWQDKKIFQRIWKRTKIQTNTVPTEPRTSFVFVEKTDRRWFATNCSQTVREPQTNYTNIVFRSWFVNKIFANVYTALHSLLHRQFINDEFRLWNYFLLLKNEQHFAPCNWRMEFLSSSLLHKPNMY